MKQGWEIKKLGEVCEIVGGSTPKTNEPSYWDGEHYWVTPAELDGAKYISSTSRTITDEGVKSAHLQLLPSGTVLLSSRAPIGKVAITTTPMYCNQGFKNLVCSTKLHNEFVYWFLYHRKEYLNSLGTGATFKEISKRVVEQIPIPVPPREEQERIVEILDREFERIDALKANAEKSLQHAKELFQSALKQELHPKKGWETAPMNKIYDVRDGTHDSPRYHTTGYPLITSKNLCEDFIDMDNVKYISKEDYDKINERSKVDVGDVLFAMIGTIGNPTLVVKEPNFAIKNMALFKVPNNQSGSLLRYILSTDEVLGEMKIKAKGANQPFVSLGYLRSFEISIPATREQQDEIVARLDILNERCKALEENYKKTIALCDDMKQALLRKAFNGEL